MDQVIPWAMLAKEFSPHYPEPKGVGRRPKGLERMLRIYCMQHLYNLSDPALEEALYDSDAMREFARVDLGEERAPDESTILQFRHLMETHEFGAELLHPVNAYLSEKGMTISRGTIVEATIIAVPSSARNREKARDSEMHQTRKGNQWYFGLKAHSGVDSKTKQVHSAAVTAANVHDSRVLEDLLHGEERRVLGDSAYSDQQEVLAEGAPMADDFTQAKGRRNKPLTEEDKRRNRTKTGVRAKVEHVFGVLKRQSGFTKVRYRGLEKNANHLFVDRLSRKPR